MRSTCSYVRQFVPFSEMSLCCVGHFLVPGWGSWGGLGTQPPRKKAKPAPIKETVPKPRKDDGKRFVIINEEVDTKAAKHGVS